MKKSFRTLAFVGIAAMPLSTHAITEADIDRSFYPYREGVPSIAGLTPGMTLTKSNVAGFKDAMDPGLFLAISSGWVEVKVGPTTSFDLNKNYVNATKANAEKVKLGAKPGELTGFVAGRPFPEEPDGKDARAGEKLAWNFKYSMNYGDTGTISPFYWKYRDMSAGKVERTLKWEFHFLNYRHRVIEEPRPNLPDNPSQIYRATYARVLEPLDLKNTQVLIQRYEDDARQDDGYLYLGFQRRVRRLASGQTTDAFLGTDIMVEDFESYNGRVSDYKWAYKGTANILLPFYNHDEQKLSEEYKEPDGFRFVDYHGQGGCFANITWQLRKTYILEGKPVDPAHPISKRIYYMDAQTAALTRNVIYDRKGELWKVNTVAKSHADHHTPMSKGKGVAVDDAAVMVDVQAKHCTTFQFKTQLDPAQSPQGLFSVQNMRGAQ